MKGSGVIATSAALLLASPFAALAQEKVSDGVVKIGMLEDMSSIYADITGRGAVTVAKMAVEDFGGKVLGKPIEVVAADHLNKPDIASSIVREWFVTYDNYALAHGTGSATVKAGYDTWFFLTADYAFGHDLEQITATFVRAGGGRVLGNVRVPMNTLDFSSALLQAQSSKAKVGGLANAGADTTNSIKQAAEFGIVRGGQKMAGLLVFINDVNTLGLEAAQGMLLTNAFYWDRNEESRAWAQRYFQRMSKMPNMTQAGIYSATTHYLKAVEAAGTAAP